MIVTSEAFQKMMLAPELRSRIEITISNGVETITVRDKRVVNETLTANWRASNNQAFTLGTCYAASLNFSSFDRMSTRVEGDFLTISPTLFYKTGENQEERMPLGIFRCDNPTAYAKTTSYECYDLMLAMDKAITSRTAGNAYQLLTFMCRECGVTLGNTAQEIAAMINGNITLYLDPNYITTHRDALAYISIILGGYAIFGRDGRLYIRQFHKTPDRTLSRKRVTTESFAAYHSYFQGVKCRFLSEQNFFPYEKYSDTREDGVVLDLGDIPIVEGTPTVKQAILDRIFDEIKDVDFTPASISMVGDPSIEPGDMITVKDREGYDKNVILTSVTFTWRKECEIVSEGSNPKLGAVTTVEKRNAQRSDRQESASRVVTATYRNAGSISVEDSPEQITNIRFVTNKELTAVFGAEIPVYSSGDGYIKITYLDTGLEKDTVRARLLPGYNLITLVNHMPFEANSIVNLTLEAETEGLAGGTAPTVTIEQDTIRSYIFAQGIETEAPWDGIIVIDQNIEYVDSVLSVYGLQEGLTVTLFSDVQKVITASLDYVAATLQTQSLSGSLEIILEYGDHILRMGMGHRAGGGRMFDGLRS